jgi:hypothetical protein
LEIEERKENVVEGEWYMARGNGGLAEIVVRILGGEQMKRIGGVLHDAKRGMKKVGGGLCSYLNEFQENLFAEMSYEGECYY